MLGNSHRRAHTARKSYAINVGRIGTADINTSRRKRQCNRVIAGPIIKRTRNRRQSTRADRNRTRRSSTIQSHILTRSAKRERLSTSCKHIPLNLRNTRSRACVRKRDRLSPGCRHRAIKAVVLRSRHRDRRTTHKCQLVSVKRRTRTRTLTINSRDICTSTQRHSISRNSGKCP